MSDLPPALKAECDAISRIFEEMVHHLMADRDMCPSIVAAGMLPHLVMLIMAAYPIPDDRRFLIQAIAKDLGVSSN
jgi:hypothetical protein